jgi:hypothetical protein
MPIPRRMRQVNRALLNKATRPVSRWLPGMGVVVHRGRRSGRQYQTPVNVFPRPGGREIRVVARAILGLLGVNDFLELETVPDA